MQRSRAMHAVSGVKANSRVASLCVIEFLRITSTLTPSGKEDISYQSWEFFVVPLNRLRDSSWAALFARDSRATRAVSKLRPAFRFEFWHFNIPDRN
jgi:hypothetical protein